MADELFSVSGQVVLVTGGSRGIGRAIAEGFARRQAHVAICSVNPDSVEKTRQEFADSGLTVHSYACDVQTPAQIEACVAQVIQDHGRIDTLVNVAGVNRRKRAETVTVDDYDFILDTNLRGAFLMCQEVGRRMIQNSGGTIINVESLNTWMPLKGVLPYAMSKFGMQGMTKGLAMEWARHKIRVNSLAPGFILTDLTRKLWSDPNMQEWNAQNCPMQRLGSPDDMVGTAIFLASPASAFMTGQTLYVDGGFSAGWNWPIPLD